MTPAIRHCTPIELYLRYPGRYTEQIDCGLPSNRIHFRRSDT